MSIDYAEIEREFLANLEAETGRSLAGWLAAIDAAALANRNAIIDWLRANGFPFSRASWLERIHHNGGRPIYFGQARAQPSPERKPRAAAQRPKSAPAPAAGPETAVILSLTPRLAKPAAAPPVPASIPALDGLIAKAKGYGPLARFLLSAIAKAVPAATFDARDGFIEVARSAPFAVLTLSPRDVRLGLVLPGRDLAGNLEKAKFPASALGIPPSITHMILLTDARAIGDDLLGLVRLAAAGEAGR
jgi:hypothetical protein